MNDTDKVKRWVDAKDYDELALKYQRLLWAINAIRQEVEGAVLTLGEKGEDR